MDDDELFELSLDIGKEIIKSGGELHRAKDTVKRINSAYSKDCVVFAIPNLIIAQSESKISMRKITAEETDLSELARLNALSRRLCNEYDEEINITKKAVYKKSDEMLCTCLATFCFCLYFGGSIIDGIFCAISGLIMTRLSFIGASFPTFSLNLISSFFAGVMSFLPSVVGIKTHPDKIMVGIIMLLVPGLTIVNSMRDMMSGELIGGLIELFDAIMSALAIAVGFAGAVIIFT